MHNIKATKVFVCDRMYITSYLKAYSVLTDALIFVDTNKNVNNGTYLLL